MDQRHDKVRPKTSPADGGALVETPMRPRLAGRFKRGKSPEVTFYEDELAKRAAKDSGFNGPADKKPVPNSSTEQPKATEAEPAAVKPPKGAPAKARPPSKDGAQLKMEPPDPERQPRRAGNSVVERSKAEDAKDERPKAVHATDKASKVAHSKARASKAVSRHLGPSSHVDTAESVRSASPGDAETSKGKPRPNASDESLATSADKSEDDDRDQSSGTTVNHSNRASSGQDSGDLESGDDEQSERRSVRPAAATGSGKMTRSKAASASTVQAGKSNKESSSDDGVCAPAEHGSESVRSASSGERAASRGPSISPAATNRTDRSRDVKAGRSRATYPSSMMLGTIKDDESSSGEGSSSDHGKNANSKRRSQSGRSVFSKAQSRGTSKRSAAPADRTDGSRSAKGAYSHTTYPSSLAPKTTYGGSSSGSSSTESSSDDSKNTQVERKTKSRRSTSKAHSESSRGRSKVSAGGTQIANKSKLLRSELSAANTAQLSEQSSEKGADEQLEYLRSFDDATEHIHSRRLSARQEPGLSADEDGPLIAAAADTGHQATRFVPSRHSYSEPVPSVSNDSIDGRPSSTSRLTPADKASAESAKKWHPFCESPGYTNHEHASASRAPSKQSPADLARQSSTPRVLQSGGLPVVFRQELCLYPLSLVLVMAAFVVALMFFAPKAKPLAAVNKSPVTCSSPSCLRDSVYLDNLLNWNFDPCDNFYMFVCSRWRNRFPASEGSLHVSADDDYVNILESQIHAQLQGQPLGSYAGDGTMQDLYYKCANDKLIEDSGWDGLLEFMSDVSLDGFPLTPPVRSSVSLWKIAARLLRKTGAAALINVAVVSHPVMPTKDIISVGLPETFTAIDGVDINDAIRLYTSIVFATFKALRKDFIPPVHTLSVVKFASDLEKLSSQLGDQEARIEALDTASSLQTFMAELFDGVSGSAYTGPGCKILVQSPGFVAKLVALVKETELHTVMNFLGVRLMVQVATFIPQSGLAEAFATLLYGKWRQADLRWKTCVRVAEKAVSPLFHRASLEKLIAQVPLPRFTDLVKDIVREFLSGVDATPYLNDVARVAVRNIVSRTRFLTLAPAWIFNRTLVSEYAQRIPPISSEKPLMSYVTVHEYSFVSSLTRGSGERWTHSIFSTNCWYERGPRSIYVPMLLFNLTFLFDNDVYNFELSRAGFRISQCLLDMLLAEANSTDPTERWLDRDTKAKMGEAQLCFGKGVAPKHMAKEMRDATALRFAYNHFRRKSRAGAMSFHLGPRQNVSASQMFFVYLMLQSCERKNSKDEASTESGVAWNAALRNQREFPQEFRCPLGSAMNPEKQCDV
ncbi:hypothetical protein V5799_012629 [Amblyomma americanum]|uniref:M13 family peptidase n=1 Tax=Amblyomma americanum TaxID=6943 RepID=A0AAQ4EDZ3_AMBAM